MSARAPGSRRSRLLIVIALVIVAACALRIAAPSLITRYLNRTLADLGAYRGHVEDVDLALLRGRYALDGLRVVKVDSIIEEPLLSAPRIEASVQWRALLQGELVADALLIEPRVSFVQQGRETQYGEETDWRRRLEELFPIRVNHIEIRGGHVHFMMPDAQPPVDVFLADVNMVVANLSNVRESNTLVFAELDASASAMGHAPFQLAARLDPLQEPPTFDLSFDLRDLELTRLNPLLLHYANVTAEGGEFSVSGEVAAAEGAYEGYVKPLLDHASFIEPEEFKERPLGAIWDTIVAGVAELLENQPRDRIGTRVPLSGEFRPQPEVWPAIGGIFGNMFDALLQGIEGSVDLRDAFDRAREDDDDSEQPKDNEPPKDV